MFHTCAFAQSTGNTANTDQAPVPDDILVIQNNHFLLQRDWLLLAAYAGGTSLDRARLVTPSLRQITLPFIRPVNVGLLPITLTPVDDLRANPLRLRALEELATEHTNTAVGPTINTTVLCLSQGPVSPIPSGDIFTMRGTGTTTLGVNSWTSITTTWADTLPAGLYSCVGLSAFSTGCQAARLIFEDQVQRPGCVGGAGIGTLPNPIFIDGNLGEYGRFNANRMPTVQFLSASADTAETVYLQLIRIG